MGDETHHLRVGYGAKAGDENVCLDLCDVLCRGRDVEEKEMKSNRMNFT